MPEIHKKICVECLKEFESPGSKNCPYCGSNSWNFLNEDGRVVISILEAQKRKREMYQKKAAWPPMTEERAKELIEVFYPHVIEKSIKG